MRNPVLNRAIFVLSFVGLLIAGYLWKMHAHPQDIPCGGTGGCEMVANSPYSRFPVGDGPPVAMYGTIGYLAILILSFLRSIGAGSLAPQNRDRIFLILIVSCALFGTLVSGYLTYMEIEVIDAICRWCMTSQILILLILGLSITEGIAIFKGAKTIDAGGAGQ